MLIRQHNIPLQICPLLATLQTLAIAALLRSLQVDYQVPSAKANPFIEMLVRLGILLSRQTPERCTFAHSFVYTKTPKGSEARFFAPERAADQLEAAITRTDQGCQFPPSHKELVSRSPSNDGRTTDIHRRSSSAHPRSSSAPACTRP